MNATPTTPRRSFGARLIGAARLDADVYEEVEADTRATPQAALVVMLSAAAVAVGGLKTGLLPVVSGVFAELLGWLVWSGITYLIGAKALGGVATWGELRRTIGFAQAPGLLSVLRAVPTLEQPVVHIVRLWKLIAVIVAIRQALDVGTGRAIVTAALGFIAYVALAAGVMLLVGAPIVP